LLVFLDVEHLVQPGDLEDFEDVLGDVTQDELAAGAADLLVEVDELAERGTGEILDVAEVQKDLAAAQLVDEAEQVFADLLNVLLVEDLAVDEVDDRDVADIFHFQAAAPRCLR